MSNIFQKIRVKLNPFTGKLDCVGQQNMDGVVTEEQLAPFKAETSANFQDVKRTLLLMQDAVSGKQDTLTASSYSGLPILDDKTIRSLNVSDIQNLLTLSAFGTSLQLQLSDKVATKDYVNNTTSSLASSLSNGISSAFSLANQAKAIAEVNSQKLKTHWETYPVLASESGDEFSQLASGIQNNQGIIFWMSILAPITFSECLIYAVSFPSAYVLQVGIYDEGNNLICKTEKKTVSDYGTIRFSFVDDNGKQISQSLSNDKLYKIAIWSSANNFRILAGQDCSSAFQSIRQLMSAKLVQNSDGLTDTAEIEENSFINRFPYIKLVG